MTLNLATEEAIRGLNNPYISKSLDLWREVTEGRLGRPLEVVLGNRRKHPALSGYKGLNTQVTLSTLENRSYLALWYDPYEIKYAEMVKEMGRSQELVNTIGPMLEAGFDLGPDYEPAQNLAKLDWDMLLRKILLWVLRARGFKKMANRDNRFAELESIINTECWTPALNRLLAEMGYELSSSLTDLVEDTVAAMTGMEEPTRRADKALNALRIWNLLSACDPGYAEPLKRLLEEKFPRVNEIIGEVAEMAASRDLSDPEEVLKFTKGFITKYRLPGEWESADEFSGFLKGLAG